MIYNRIRTKFPCAYHYIHTIRYHTNKNRFTEKLDAHRGDGCMDMSSRKVHVAYVPVEKEIARKPEKHLTDNQQ